MALGQECPDGTALEAPGRIRASLPPCGKGLAPCTPRLPQEPPAAQAFNNQLTMAVGDIVTETAKALSAPVTKLIEVAAAGCGKLYEPTGIRRNAKAEGDALVIIAEAHARADEVSLRAAQRLLEVEARRQINIEAIIEQAKLQLPAEVSQEPVARDWAARFFREAQDISDEQMRGLWSRLLAGEVARPGTFSARTLTVVRDLSPSEAAEFNRLCMRCVKINGRWTPLLPHGADFTGAGFTRGEMLRLESAGLVIVQMRQFEMPGEGPFTLETRGGASYLVTWLQDYQPNPLSLGDVALTDSGNELAALAVGEERIEYLQTEFIPFYRSGAWNVEQIK